MRRPKSSASLSRSSASTTAAATRRCSGLVQKAARDPRVKVIALARNFGKEAALTAGIEAATGDMVVPIDADLQDPPELIAEFVKRWEAGYDVVYGARADRSSDTAMKRTTAQLFYRIFNRVSDLDIPESAGDFRLMDRAGGRGAEAAAGAQPLHEGTVRLGGLPTDRRALRAARARGRDQHDGLSAALAFRDRRHHLVLDRAAARLVGDRPGRRVRRGDRGGRR